MTVTVDDLRFTVEPSPVGEDFVTFQLMYMPNGIYNRFTQIGVMFNKGVLDRFADNWNSCVVGSSEVNVSEEQAISLAKEHIAAYSYMFGNRSIGNLTVKESLPPLATLSMQVRKDNLLYPRWELLVPLAKFTRGLSPVCMFTCGLTRVNCLSSRNREVEEAELFLKLQKMLLQSLKNQLPRLLKQTTTKPHP